MKHKIAIIGSGPAGLATAIYTSRAEIDTTIYAGDEPGGQLTKTTEIENYPGVMGKTGPELMVAMTQQAQKFGAKVEYLTINKLTNQQTNGKIKIFINDETEQEYDAVILAMGASSRLMGVGEDRYWGKGFSTCAVCDAAFYRGKNVYVVGGGDAAIEDAMALTKFASKVTILVRKTEFRASKAMQNRINNNLDKVEIMWNTNLQEIRGEKVDELVLDVAGEKKIVKADGLFFAIGHIPATGFLKDSGVELDELGYIKTEAGYPTLRGVSSQVSWPTMTNEIGIFAAGDCVDHRYRQAATAVGMGVQAALDCERWLESK